MEATFLVEEQKEHLHRLNDLLNRIDTCDRLGDIDPAYYGEKKQEYIIAYAMQMSKMAQTVFKRGMHQANARLLGVINVV